MKSPLILEIKGNSLDDGPGIRSVVFFKGCPLSCVWCHNPESKSSSVQIAFDAGECVGCGTCLETCTHGALSRENPYFIDRDKCTLCFECADNCPSGALSRVGSQMSVEDIVGAIIKYKPFFDNSGGGVTLSGGEPTMHPEFLGGLLARLKENGVHTLLETCGLFKWDRFQELIYPHLDMIYMDVKIADPAKHAKYCGVENTLILENFQKLNELYVKGGVEVLPRTPLIPGITDDDGNLRGVIDFLKNCGVKKAQLLPYHPLWQDKNAKIGVHDPLGDAEEMKNFLADERLESAKAMFTNAGIEI